MAGQRCWEDEGRRSDGRGVKTVCVVARVWSVMGDHHVLEWRVRRRGEKKVGVDGVERESRPAQSHGHQVDYLTRG